MAHKMRHPAAFGLFALSVAALVALVAIFTGGVSPPASLAAVAQRPPAQPLAEDSTLVAPKADIRIVPVRANPADENKIEAALANGTKVQFGTTGLDVVSVGVPVTLQALPDNPNLPVDKYTWTLAGPSTSSAKLTESTSWLTKFTPDVSGIYKVDLVLTNAAGSSPMASIQIRAGEYIGVQAGNCGDCHPGQTSEWAETGHATLIKEQINGGDDPANSHYGEGCIRCHTTGYAIGANNGGFAAQQAATGWTFPTLEQIQSGQDNFSTMPKALRNLANIGCEDCHGPAKDHVLNGAKMAKSLDEGVCNQCHDGGGHHIKGSELRFAAHADKESQAFTYPVGPSRQACVRCHSGSGYASFIAAPKEQASWSNEEQHITCATCHDPHSDKNTFQLRIVGKPVEAVGITKDFGLSATCVECHNARTLPAAAATGGTPHYSAAGELLADTGGVTYGQNVPNSPHGQMVGSSPVKDPADATGKTMLFGGNTPGACVTCHMWPTADAKSGFQFQVGEHSFNMTSPDGWYENVGACQSCHKGVQSWSDFKAKADYDGNGKIEPVQAEVAGMLTVLQQAIGAAGVKPVQGHPYFDAADVAKADVKVKNAIYNYLFVRGLEGSDGKAAAIHNFKRSMALLQLSYKDLTGKEAPPRAMSVMATPTPLPTPTSPPTATSVPATPAAGAPAAVAPAPAAPAPVAPAPAPARPASIGPVIPHSLAGRDSCLTCHSLGNIAVPASHAGRTEQTCTACHQPAA